MYAICVNLGCDVDVCQVIFVFVLMPMKEINCTFACINSLCYDDYFYC